MGHIVILASYNSSFILLENMKIWCQIQVIINPFYGDMNQISQRSGSKKGSKLERGKIQQKSKEGQGGREGTFGCLVHLSPKSYNCSYLLA